MASIHILAVDDDTSHLAAVRRTLRRCGYEVATAKGGRAGLRAAMRVRPDLILLDVSMPMMSGQRFLRRFRRLEQRLFCEASHGAASAAPTPVIFLSARGLSHERVSGLDAGAIDYIVKPFEPDELRARVRRSLRESRKQTAAEVSA